MYLWNKCLYDIKFSAIMLHFIFCLSISKVVFYEIRDDVNDFLTAYIKICTAYVKLEIKDILLRLKNYVYCSGTLPPPPFPLGHKPKDTFSTQNTNKK